MNKQGKTVLILEDEKPLLDAVKAWLESEGLSVMTARSVDQALNYLREGVKIDLIWLDHYLFGKKSGLDFVTELKQGKSSWKNLPIFVVSNTTSPDKVRKYLKLGVQGFYSKVDTRLDQIVPDIRKLLKSSVA